MSTSRRMIAPTTRLWCTQGEATLPWLWVWISMTHSLTHSLTHNTHYNFHGIQPFNKVIRGHQQSSSDPLGTAKQRYCNECWSMKKKKKSTAKLLPSPLLSLLYVLVFPSQLASISQVLAGVRMDRPPPPWLNGRPSKIPRTQGNDPSWVVARHGVSSKPPPPPHFTIRGHFIVFFTTQVKKR